MRGGQFNFGGDAVQSSPVDKTSGTTQTSAQAPQSAATDAAQDVAALDQSIEQPAVPQEADVDAQADKDGPEFDVVRIEPDGLSVIAGRAKSPGQVTLELDGAALQSSTVEAGPDGRFVMMLEIPRKASIQSLGLVHQPENAPTPVRSSERIFVDATPVADQVAALDTPMQTEIETPQQPQSDIQVDLPEPAAQPRLLIADDAGLRVLPSAREPAQVAVVALDTISYDQIGDVALGGRASGTGFVRVYLDNQPITTSRIQDDGYWAINLPEVKSGIYTLRLDELSADGAVESRIETPFKREAPETLRKIIPENEVADGPVNFKVKTVQPGATLWAIAEERYGAGVAYVKVFEANRDSIQDPDLIYPGQVFKTPD